MKSYHLILDLKNDPELIEAYKEHHRQVWPEVEKSIVDSGIESLDIYLLGNRLVMHLTADDDFSFEDKAKADLENPEVQAWEALMWKYQQALPGAAPGEKWQLMEKIYELKSPSSNE